MGETPNAEVDYMLGDTLCNEPDLYKTGCRLLGLMKSLYQSPIRIGGQLFDLDEEADACCQQPPGVRVVFRTIAPVRQRLPILDEIQQARRPAPDPAGLNGVYEMVHDGWRGKLEIRYPVGRYVDAAGKSFRVRCSPSQDYHLVFYVIGLGGQNADNTRGQKFEGYLMTQTRDAMAGTTWWQGAPFGFYATKRRTP